MTIIGYDAWKLRTPGDDHCEDCGGFRTHDCTNCGGDGEIAEYVPCPVCEGSGTVECETCGDGPDPDYAREDRDE